MTVRDGKVCAIWDIANPDKFTGSPLLLLVSPRNPARVTGVEALLGDAQRGVHAGPHVLDADLIGQLDDAARRRSGVRRSATCSSVTVCGSVVIASA